MTNTYKETMLERRGRPQQTAGDDDATIGGDAANVIDRRQALAFLKGNPAGAKALTDSARRRLCLNGGTAFSLPAFIGSKAPPPPTRRWSKAAGPPWREADIAFTVGDVDDELSAKH